MTRTLLLGCAAALIAFPADGRTWTNDEGRTIEADLTRVRGRTAYLRTADGEIPAPIARLSEEDQEYVKQYSSYRRTREWGDGQRARFFKVDDDAIVLLVGGDLKRIPFDQLNNVDREHVAEALRHSGLDVPAGLRPRRPSSSGEPVITGEEPVRAWTNAKGKRIEAAYLGTRGDRVLMAIKGKVYRVPIASLSSDDQLWLARQGLMALLGNGQQAAAAAGQLVGGAAASAAQPAGPPFGPPGAGGFGPPGPGAYPGPEGFQGPPPDGRRQRTQPPGSPPEDQPSEGSSRRFR